MPRTPERRAELLADALSWTETNFDDLRKGDVFRLFEPDGSLVHMGDYSILRATANAQNGSIMVEPFGPPH